MIWKIAKSAALAACVLAAACQSKPKDEMVISIGPDGKMTVASTGKTPEDRAMAALLQSALDEEAAKKDAPAGLSEDDVFRKDADGNITHIQSGATCPVAWAGLTRDRVLRFNGEGTDVGCNYVTPRAGPTYMTFYVYQRPGGMEEAMKEALDQMTARQPIYKDTPFLVSSGNGAYQARALAYAAADGTPMRTSVVIAHVNSWLLKIRLTCRAVDAAQAEQSAALGVMGQADRLRLPRPAVGPAPPPI